MRIESLYISAIKNAPRKELHWDSRFFNIVVKSLYDLYYRLVQTNVITSNLPKSSVKVSNDIRQGWRWRVRELMKEKGLRVSEVARRAGISPATVQAFCRDPKHETTTAMWKRLAEALGVSLVETLECVPEGDEHI